MCSIHSSMALSLPLESIPPSTVMAEQGGYIIAGLKKGITDAISSVAETAKKILSAIKSAFDNFSLFDIGKKSDSGSY